jgi:hypothetical protein
MIAKGTRVHADSLCFSSWLRVVEMSTNKPQTFLPENKQYPVLPHHIENRYKYEVHNNYGTYAVAYIRRPF